MCSFVAEIRETPTFEWSTEHKLGEGSFGIVFKGKKKNGNCKEVAVKCLKAKCAIGVDEVEKSKLLIGKKHRNIIQLIAIEQEIGKQNFVMIMELCTGPNMLQVIREPNNVHGLEEKEFEDVLKDLTNAVRFLNKHHILHRDIKPANILKKEFENDTTIYKLTDFGTVRLYKIEEEFSTQCGTDAYIDPKCLGKFVFGVGTVDSSVDLWSIGVTLYQLATNLLPFKFTDIKTLFEYTRRKESGIIAASNKNPNGIVEAQRSLPDTCRLSKCLKRFLTRLLAGLLETEDDVKWSYKQYFDYVDMILENDEITISSALDSSDVNISSSDSSYEHSSIGAQKSRAFNTKEKTVKAHKRQIEEELQNKLKKEFEEEFFAFKCEYDDIKDFMKWDVTLKTFNTQIARFFEYFQIINRASSTNLQGYITEIRYQRNLFHKLSAQVENRRKDIFDTLNTLLNELEEKLCSAKEMKSINSEEVKRIENEKAKVEFWLKSNPDDCPNHGCVGFVDETKKILRDLALLMLQ